MTSPQPLTINRQGALAMTSVSAIIASGAWAKIEYGLSEPLIDASGLAIPSWETVVGMLMNGIFWVQELIFAASIMVPPPTPKSTCGFVASIRCSIVIKSFMSIAVYLENIHFQSRLLKKCTNGFSSHLITL